MQLSHVDIKNYRSIQELKITFDPKCRILVGINESGKTNIIVALRILDPEQKPSKRDVREAGKREPAIEEAYVRFVFRFDDEELKQIETQIKESFLVHNVNDPLISLDGAKYTFREFFWTREGLYKTDLLSGVKDFRVWKLNEPKIASNWKQVSAACPSDFQLDIIDGGGLLKDYKFVNTKAVTDIPADYLTEPDFKVFNEQITAAVNSQTKANLLKVLFWNYDEENLLPPKINLDQFCANPDLCLPLKRMFQLYGTTEILKEITAAKARGANSVDNLLGRVAEKTTKHFHKTWREYDNVHFSLRENGTDLVAGIRDKSNHYELAQRSDGFKRFVTFLLMVSAEDESNLLRDSILIIDEPEIGLHPTGARYLMEELIDISKNNYVVFSTHSVFMIDSRAINRHLIVKKDDEITAVEQVSESNIQDEEVIYRALGYSIFANFKQKNIIFEGWRDKHLFDVAISKIPATHSGLASLKEVGRCFTKGVKGVKCVTPLFEAGERKCLILSDCDPVAKQEQKEYQKERGYGKWKRFDEVVPATTAITGEDFVKSAAFKSAVDSVRERYNIPVLEIGELDAPANGKINRIKQWMQSNAITAEDTSKSITEIKELVFDKLKASDVLPEYYDYLSGVKTLVDDL